MKIKFLGTGSAKTNLARAHSSILVTSNKKQFLIDCGDGIPLQLLKFSININKIESVIISHNHPDHLSGLFSLINQMKLAGRNIPLNIYLEASFAASFWYVMNTFHLYKETISFQIIVIQLKDNIKFIPVSGVVVTCKKNSHVKRKEVLQNYTSQKFNSFSFLIEGTKNNIFYTADVGSENDLLLFKKHRIDYLIADSFHISVAQIIIAAQSLQPKRTIVTHIEESDYKKEIAPSIKKFSNIIAAVDGMEILV